jgi:hypothetical protein
VRISDLERALRASWSERTCDPVDLETWSADNPALGQCGVSAAVIQDYLGGELLVAEVSNADGSRQGVHYWNLLPDGGELDLTREQFRAGESIGEPSVVAREPEPRTAGRLAQQYARLAAAVRGQLG